MCACCLTPKFLHLFGRKVKLTQNQLMWLVEKKKKNLSTALICSSSCLYFLIQPLRVCTHLLCVLAHSPFVCVRISSFLPPVLAAAVTQASLRSVLHKLLTAGPAFNITALLSAAQHSNQGTASSLSLTICYTN